MRKNIYAMPYINRRAVALANMTVAYTVYTKLNNTNTLAGSEN